MVSIVILQIKFELVSEDELETQRKQFRNGELQIKIEEEEFNMRCACHPRALQWYLLQHRLIYAESSFKLESEAFETLSMAWCRP